MMVDLSLEISVDGQRSTPMRQHLVALACSETVSRETFLAEMTAASATSQLIPFDTPR
jgi:hypothetical protein